MDNKVSGGGTDGLSLPVEPRCIPAWEIVYAVTTIAFCAVATVTIFFLCPLSLAIGATIGGALFAVYNVISLQKTIRGLCSKQTPEAGSGQVTPPPKSGEKNSAPQTFPASHAGFKCLGHGLNTAALLFGGGAALTLLLGLWPVTLALFAVAISCMAVGTIFGGIARFHEIAARQENDKLGVPKVILMTLATTLTALPIVLALLFSPLSATLPLLLLLSLPLAPILTTTVGGIFYLHWKGIVKFGKKKPADSLPPK
ncbi:MAG: hypothetical protein LBT98_02355 [Puniceicoccales bacterium]|jgi:hypothetical protein|nr:hypothetical protein [Puniceicoccales bacterium]